MRLSQNCTIYNVENSNPKKIDLHSIEFLMRSIQRLIRKNTQSR